MGFRDWILSFVGCFSDLTGTLGNFDVWWCIRITSPVLSVLVRIPGTSPCPLDKSARFPRLFIQVRDGRSPTSPTFDFMPVPPLPPRCAIVGIRLTYWFESFGCSLSTATCSHFCASNASAQPYLSPPSRSMLTAVLLASQTRGTACWYYTWWWPLATDLVVVVLSWCMIMYTVVNAYNNY